MKITDILSTISYEKYLGDELKDIDRVIPFDQINEFNNCLSWCSDKNIDGLRKIKNDSSVVIVSNNVSEDTLLGLNCIVVRNPRRAFQEVLMKFFKSKRLPEIHSTSIIDNSARIGQNVFIGGNVVIEKGCEIGDNVSIMHNTVILEDTVIHENVTIGSNSTIGGVGFGYEKNETGDFELIPHIGNVLINRNVDIGSNTCIDRAVLGSTIIEENAKIDNLVHIAHGVIIGRNSVVIANAMIAGSVKVGENSWISPSASIINKKNIGKNALVGLGAVVTKNVEDNTVVVGNPARFIRNV